MTYDQAGGSYWGTLSHVDGTNITTSNDCKSAGDMVAGGWAGGVIVILNGTGAGILPRSLASNSFILNKPHTFLVAHKYNCNLHFICQVSGVAFW